MRKSLLFLFCVVILDFVAGAQDVGGIIATTLASHFYNTGSSTGYLTFGFNNTTGAGTSTPDPLTIQKSNLSIGINNNNPQAKLHITSAGNGAGSTVLVNNSTGTELFRILDNGNIGIGISTPQTTLAVAGVISSKKVKVTQSGWPDFVFNSNYNLPDLMQLERYILQHKHLPGVVSEDEVKKGGLDLGDNQAAMLQKIEELTLYVIQQEKEIQQLKAANDQLLSIQNQLDELKKQLNSLQGNH